MRALSWRPGGRRNPVLSDLDLRIEPGQRVLLAGPSGSGKSTLLRAIAGLLQAADVGEQRGEVHIDGRSPRDRAGSVGLLLQDPSAAVVADKVGRDVAFGLENTGVPRPLMPGLVHDALTAAGFPYDEARRTDSLSGGETQRLALAGALAMRPQVLLLDEPTSMLDEHNAAQVRRAVLASCERDGTTLVVVEHHLEPWLEHVDRCVVLGSDGAVVADGEPHEVLRREADALTRQGTWLPALPPPEPLPVEPALVTPWTEPPTTGPLLAARGVTVRYRSALARRTSSAGVAPALDDIGCEVHAGRTLLLRGPSGAGKSTLLAVLAGLQEPDLGVAEIHPDLAGHKGRALTRLSSQELADRLAWVPQLPLHGLVGSTVLEELLVSARVLGRPEGEARRRATELLEVLGLASLADRSVHHLSGGEQRRLVVAAAVVHGPGAILLDEPTVGQDRTTWAAVAGVCRGLADAGAAVVLASHDPFAEGFGAPERSDRLRIERGRTA